MTISAFDLLGSGMEASSSHTVSRLAVNVIEC
jgi:hypothetical protein